MRKAWTCLPLVAVALAACMEQQTLDRTQSRFVTVEGRRLRVDLSATGQPQEFDLLVVRDTIVINPDPDRELARAEVASARVMREVCNLRRLSPEVVSARMDQTINYHVRFRCV